MEANTLAATAVGAVAPRDAAKQRILDEKAQFSSRIQDGLGRPYTLGGIHDKSDCI